MKRVLALGARLVSGLAAAALLLSCAQPPMSASASAGDVPHFRVDAAWPQTLPEKDGMQLIFGQVASVAVDPRTGHVWALHRPATLLADEQDAETHQPVTPHCCASMPPVVEFDAQGRFLRGWGGPGAGYAWPKQEHSIYVDDEGNLWIGGNAVGDGQILKFAPDGRFLMQVGHPGPSEGSNSTTQLGQPASLTISRGELFIGDGYGNPHCVRVSNDDLVYVCDRPNDRIQVFTRDGQFKHEFRIDPQTVAGTVWDMVLSTDLGQNYMYVGDGANGRVYILRRSDGRQVGQFGRTGRMAGEFKWIHNMAIDAQGNLYTAEVGYGRRLQRFVN